MYRLSLKNTPILIREVRSERDASPSQKLLPLSKQKYQGQLPNLAVRQGIKGVRLRWGEVKTTYGKAEQN